MNNKSILVSDEPKIILFDLETIPNTKEIMKIWPGISNYPGLSLKATINTIICAGWKVLGQKRTHCINAWDFPEWKRDINDDKKVCEEIFKVLKTADAVVTHNGKRFDWKFLQTRLMYHKLGTLPKTHHIDTCQEMKKNLYAFNNRLGTAGELLAGDKKLENGGWQLWVKVSNRDKKAQNLMEKYCKQDVNLLEKVYIALRPLIKGIPNYNIFVAKYAGGKDQCPMCGSTRLVNNGIRYNATTSYQRVTCNDCGGSSRLDGKGRMPRAL